MQKCLVGRLVCEAVWERWHYRIFSGGVLFRKSTNRLLRRVGSWSATGLPSPMSMFPVSGLSLVGLVSLRPTAHHALNLQTSLSSLKV